MSHYFPLECLRNTSLYLPCASFAVQKKISGRHGLEPQSLRSQKSISWHVFVPWPVPVPGSVSAHGAQHKSVKWKDSYAGASHRCPDPPPTHIASCSVCIPLWLCPEGALQVAPLPAKSMSVECEKQTRLLSKYHEDLIIVMTQYFCIIECLISNLYYIDRNYDFYSVVLMVNWCVSSHKVYLAMRSLACGKQASIYGFSRTVSRLQHS